MLFNSTTVAAFLIAFGLTISATFSQTTLQEASGKPEIHEALLKRSPVTSREFRPTELVMSLLDAFNWTKLTFPKTSPPRC